MEVVRALIRRKARRLRLLGVPVLGLCADLLIGAGCVEEIETSAVTLGEAGLAPRFTEAVEKGKLSYPVKGATLIGNGPDALTRVGMIGDDMALDPGVGTCGKEGQSVPVGVGQPTLRIDGLTVGGTASS